MTDGELQRRIAQFARSASIEVTAGDEAQSRRSPDTCCPEPWCTSRTTTG
jgi:hypothetical protein